jgi:hypothetical protein
VGRGFVFLPYMKVLTAASLLRLFPISTQSSFLFIPSKLEKKNFWQEPRWWVDGVSSPRYTAVTGKRPPTVSVHPLCFSFPSLVPKRKKRQSGWGLPQEISAQDVVPSTRMSSISWWEQRSVPLSFISLVPSSWSRGEASVSARALSGRWLDGKSALHQT